jgi:hypothetical protein
MIIAEFKDGYLFFRDENHRLPCGRTYHDGLYGVLRMSSVTDYLDGLFRVFREGHAEEMWYSKIVGISYGDVVFYGDFHANSRAG